MPLAAADAGDAAEARGGEVVSVAFPGVRRRVWVMQDTAIFDNEEEDELVSETKQFVPEVISVEDAGRQVVANLGVRFEEAGAQFFERLLDTVAEAVSGTDSGLVRLDAPAFQPAVGQRRRPAVYTRQRLEPG
jgi:hypothetical protein